MNPLEALHQRYSYMFNSPNLGVNVPRGWIAGFERLCEQIDALLGPEMQGFHWIQCKEKFGSGRCYFQWGRNISPMRIDIQTPDGVLSFRNDPLRQKKPRQGDDVKRKVEEMIATMESKTRSMCITIHILNVTLISQLDQVLAQGKSDATVVAMNVEQFQMAITSVEGNLHRELKTRN